MSLESQLSELKEFAAKAQLEFVRPLNGRLDKMHIAMRIVVQEYVSK